MYKVNAQQYLRQAYRLDELIKSNQEELQNLREQAVTIGAIDYAKEKIQSSPNSDAPFSRTVMKIVELEESIQADIDKLFKLKLEIRTAINNMDDADEKLLLRCRYLNFLQWDEICDEMHLSMRSVFRIHMSALKNIEIPQKLADNGSKWQ